MTAVRFDVRTAPLDAGTVLLEASAGTGKTYAVVGMLLRLLLEGGIERLDRALVVTFTVAATAELKNRLRAALQRTLVAIDHGDPDPFFAELAEHDNARATLRTALGDFDQVPIATIHGFCKRLLDEAAFESREPFELEFVGDPLPLLHECAADALRSYYTAGVTVQGAVLHRSKLDPKTLVRLHTLWRRYPEVRIEPEDPDPNALIERLELLVPAAAAALDDEACARIARLSWKKNAGPSQVGNRFSLDRWRERLVREPALALHELCAFAPATLGTTLNRRRAQPPLDHPFFAACDEVLAAADEATAHLRAALLQRMDARLDDTKQREHVLTYQDLLTRTHRALRDPDKRQAVLAAVRDRYHVALIDEFQDTDQIQYDIFADCFAGRPLYLIGDPKQSIYGFRGADVEAYLAAREDAVASYTLGVNHRSAAELVRAVQSYCGQDGAFVIDGIDLPKVDAHAGPGERAIDGEDGAPLQWRFLTNDHVTAKDGLIRKADAEARIAADVAAEISRLLRAGVGLDGERLQPRHIAVLTRTNAEALMIQQYLRDAGVISAIGKAGDVFETEEIDELECLVQAILQPRNLALCRAAMATRVYGKTAAQLADLEGPGSDFDEHLARFDGWRRTWVRRGFVVMKEELFADLELEQRFLAVRGGERRLSNLQQLCELLHGAEHGNRLSPEGLLEWLQHERLHHEEIDYTLRELRLESDEDAVQILTVHGSKGLQYEVVFCPFLWNGRPPPRESVVSHRDERKLAFRLTKDDPEKSMADVDRMAEDARLVYVALTRAIRRCYVHIGPIGSTQTGSWRSALLWFLHPLASDDRKVRARQPEGSWLEDWAQRMRKNPQQIRALVEAQVAASEGSMALCDVPLEPRAERVPAPQLPALEPPRRAERKPFARGLHSFSSIITDAPLEPLLRDVQDRAVAVDASGPPSGIFAFARGPAAGNCLHAILEHLDWNAIDTSATRNAVTQRLREHALADPAAHDGEIDPVEAVIANIRDLSRAHAAPGGPPLTELCGGTTAPEWGFTLPIRDSRTATLAELFADSSSAVAAEYANRLANLSERVLRGFLVGFVDLIAEHEGRYWVLDWKSNHLGDDVAAYGESAIALVMRDHDYVLQYHLYVLALHRQLRARLADYDYDRHFGGVCYAFLRGATPGSDNGMFHDRPPADLVEAMDRWACGTLARRQA